MTTPSGSFVWYELMTTDTAAADAFYRRVVGWGAQPAGVAGFDYTLFTAGESPVAGLMALPEEACDEGARPGWLGYIGVDDVDAMADRVTGAGGSVLRAPDDIPGIGRFAVAADPQGAVFALFRAVDEMPANPPLTACTTGYAGWHELWAADWPTAFDFYAGLFGWTKDQAIDAGEIGTYQLFARGDEPTGAMMTKPDQVPAPFWLYYLNVDSIEAAKPRVEEAGGQILWGPQEVPGGRWVLQAMDPQGAMFALAGGR